MAQRYGEVLTFKDMDKAKVGKIYVFSDNYREITDEPEVIIPCALDKVDIGGFYPFWGADSNWQFCREVLEATT